MAAADPAARTAVTTKLERLTPASADFAASIAESAKSAATEVTAQSTGAIGNLLPGGAGHATFVKKDTSDNAVYRKFEAFVLQMFVETMLPQNANDVFGKGTAGTIWRSMLAEQLGNEMAKGGGIGIAKQLAKSRAAASGEQSES
ncbi:rod-binding protein [Microbacteriaceae bacterium K1510]|nr:rod-binding protein [Microbacteriaceae bacterium K1510]